MPTLFCFNDGGSETFFFLLEGEYRHLHNVYINEGGDTEAQQQELLNLVYDSEGKIKVDKLPGPLLLSDIRSLRIILCGFLP